MKKTVLITGASSGIGKSAAFKFAREGWNVVATMRNPEKENDLKTVENILVTKLDVQDKDSITRAIQLGISQFGKIDCVINNAGYGQNGIFEAVSPEKVRQQFEVNVFGVMDLIRAILPHFRSQKSGLILNISSGAGRFTLPMISLYAASKFALEGFSEALSYELSAVNILVKIIEPGGTVTNFGNKSTEEFAYDPALTDYDPFISAAGKMFDELKNQVLATGEEVADVIYEAATDGKDTLRYAVGNEGFHKRLRDRATLPDQEYVQSVRAGYASFLPETV